jgi:hypothetical protein
MPRPDISVPRPNQTFYKATFGTQSPAATLLLLSILLVGLIVGSLNTTATIASCTVIILTVSFLLLKRRILEN